MSKWRPSTPCIYVIPDIHGKIDLLEKICDRILPLRTTGGVKDKIIFLGDYIDRGPNSPQVLDFIINLKKKYNEQIITIKGNHEDILLNACGLNSLIINPSTMDSSHLMWLKNGGVQTICSYLDLKGLKTNPYFIKPHRIAQIIPESHISFLKNLQSYYETDNFIFMHGGCDPSIPLEYQSETTFIWDRSLCRSVINKIKNGETLKWKKTIVTGHNGAIMNGRPLINEKFMMLDLNDDSRLLVVELNSCDAFLAKSGASRLVKFSLEETNF